jgi:predicted P-loop ATPase
MMPNPKTATVAPISASKNIIINLEAWLANNYSLRKNQITRMIENGGTPMESDDVNSMYIAAKKKFDRAKFEDIIRLINSQFVPRYNPIHEFFESNSKRKPQGLIDKLFETIITDDQEYARYFGTKWLVSIAASAYGQHSPLMFVLSGPKTGTGKTEWFRRLFPDQLKPYFDDISTGMKENDFHILMTQKLLLLDDEFDAKRKKEENAMKSLLSKQAFALREPYGRSNVTLARIAVLCGTTNDENILADTSTNRRFLPIGVHGINKTLYNSIDKIDLFIEAYHLWKTGFQWNLTSEEIDVLSGYTSRFENFTVEYELVSQYYQDPSSNNYTELTATQIKNRLETLSVQKLNLDQVGKALQRAGFKQATKKVNGRTNRLYKVYEINQQPTPEFSFKPPKKVSQGKVDFDEPL